MGLETKLESVIGLFQLDNLSLLGLDDLAQPLELLGDTKNPKLNICYFCSY